MARVTVDNELVADIPTNSAVLIAGPPMTGKYELLLRLLPLFADRAVLISTKNGCRRVLEDFERIASPIEKSYIGIVDCVSYHQPVDLDEVDAQVLLTNTPENLTRIGVKFTELFDRFTAEATDEPIAVGIHSISQLYMHSDMRELYQFLQVLIGQVRNEGHFVAAVVDASTTDDEAMSTIQQHFDGLVTTRENDAGTRELRLRGFGASSSSWMEF